MNQKSRFRILLPVFIILSFSTMLHADGGAIRLSQSQGAYRITVFTAPVPFRAGPVDISVLVQDDATKEGVPDARVLVRTTRLGQGGAAIDQAATSEAATNKLFRSAVFELAEPGWYSMEVSIDGPLGKAQVGFELDAAEPLPRLPAMWLWIGWPVIPIVFFGLHQVLVLRKVKA